MKKIYLYKAPNGEVPFPEFMTEPHVKHFTIARYNRLYEYRERIRIYAWK